MAQPVLEFVEESGTAGAREGRNFVLFGQPSQRGDL